MAKPSKTARCWQTRECIDPRNFQPIIIQCGKEEHSSTEPHIFLIPSNSMLTEKKVSTWQSQKSRPSQPKTSRPLEQTERLTIAAIARQTTANTVSPKALQTSKPGIRPTGIRATAKFFSEPFSSETPETRSLSAMFFGLRGR